MRCDSITAGRNRKLGRPHRVGMTPAAGIANGRDVVDIDSETKTIHALSLRMILSENRFLTLGSSPRACFVGIMR
jgi:hypothetical protein